MSSITPCPHISSFILFPPRLPIICIPSCIIVLFIIFIILSTLSLHSSMMDSCFKCRVLCGWTFGSSLALHQHCPSCTLYQQESMTNLQWKCLLSETKTVSTTLKKARLWLDNVSEVWQAHSVTGTKGHSQLRLQIGHMVLSANHQPSYGGTSKMIEGPINECWIWVGW